MPEPASDPVARPSLLDCCRAAGGMVRGLVRPRPVDERFLRTVTDAGLPTPRATVDVRALPQVPRLVPTTGVAEGVWRPRRVPSVLTSLHRVEHGWISAGATAPVGGVREALRDRPITHYDLDGPPVLTFTRSHDLFGDGSVVLVDLAGHTPGSVGVLAHTEHGWVLLAGDAAWHHVQIDKVRQKSSFPGDLVDVDRDLTFLTLHRLHLARHTVRIVATHDHDAIRALPDPA
ncbi:MBL fold metallo-hydrolase [Nocardia takedensis]